MRNIVLFISFMTVYCYVSGQNSIVRDSLHNVIKTAAHDSTKILALCRLSRIEQDDARKYKYVNEAFDIARRGKWPKGEALCYSALGDFFHGSDYVKALESYLKFLKSSEELQDRELIARALFSIGNAYRLQENFRMALPYFYKAEEIYKNRNSPDRINNYNLIGIAYEKLGKTDSALFYFNRGYEIAGQHEHVYLSRILRGLGNVHTARGDIELALSFYRKSISHATTADNLAESVQTCTQLSKLFLKKGNTDSALFYGRQAVSIAQDRKIPYTSWLGCKTVSGGV